MGTSGVPIIYVRSEAPGSVAEIVIAPGVRVSLGDELVVLESMKMMIPIKAPDSGFIDSVEVVLGQSVRQGDILVALKVSA